MKKKWNVQKNPEGKYQVIERRVERKVSKRLLDKKELRQQIAAFDKGIAKMKAKRAEVIATLEMYDAMVKKQRQADRKANKKK